MQTMISLAFADGSYEFRLPIKRIVEIEAKAGPIDLVRHRLTSGGFSIHDVVETLRQGLIGGGKGLVNDVPVEVTEVKANSLIENYVDGRPLAPNHMIARAIISALYVGYTPEDTSNRAPKKKPQTKPRRRKSTGASSSTTASPLE